MHFNNSSAIYLLAMSFCSFQITDVIGQTLEVEKSTVNFTSRQNIDYKQEGLNGLENVGSPFIYEGFEFGIPCDWSSTNTTNGNDHWEYRGPSTNPSSNVGSRGAYAGLALPIQSPTWDNGFLIFDSDYLANGGTAGNIGPAPTPHSSMITSGSIDISGYNSLMLEWYQYLRNHKSEFLVLLDFDGNNTWSDTVYNGAEFYGINNISPIDEHLIFSLYEYIPSGASSMKFRFHYKSLPNINPTGLYWWMIDDITLKMGADNNLSLIQGYYHGAGADDFSRRSANYYSKVPLRQAQNDQLLFGAEIKNNGSVAQPNTRIKTAVLGPSGFENNGVQSTLNAATRNYFDADSTWSPSELGNYKVYLRATSDSTEELSHDNYAAYDFEVTTDRYSRDNGVMTDGYLLASSYAGLYVRYDLNAIDTVVGLEIEIWSSTGFPSYPGSVVQAQVWTVEDDSGNLTLLHDDGDLGTLLTSTYDTLSSSDFNVPHFIDLPDIELNPALHGNDILVGYQLIGGGLKIGACDLTAQPYQTMLDANGNGSVDGESKLVPMISLIMTSATGTYSNPCASSVISMAASVSCVSEMDTTDMWEGDLALIDVSINSTSEISMYQWSTEENTEDINVCDTGTYVITVYDLNGCEQQLAVSVNSSSLGTCNLPCNQIIYSDPCDIENLVFFHSFICVPNDTNPGHFVKIDVEASANVSQFAWSTGEHTEDITVCDTGTYLLTISNSCCTNTYEVSVTQEDLPTCLLPCELDFVIYNGDSVYIINGDTFTFENGQLIPLSITEIDAMSQAIVYPNPNTGEFTVDFDNHVSGKLSLINSLGQLTKTMTINQENKVIFNSEINEPGVYILRFESANNEMWNKRVVLN